jgi:putative transposase
MPAYARKHQLTNSLVYHAFNRSNGRVPIFHAENDYEHFIKLLKVYSERFALKIYHWAIMDNHYHILFEIDLPENISKFMAGFGRAYTHYYQKAYQSVGHLWQGRFKLQPVQKERYLIACGRYIERNPVRKKFVSEASEYPYSSCRFYTIGLDDGITLEDPTFKDFGLDINSRREKYRKFLRDFDLRQESGFRDFDKPQGNKEFIKRLIKVQGRLIPLRRGKPKGKNKCATQLLL